MFPEVMGYGLAFAAVSIALVVAARLAFGPMSGGAEVSDDPMQAADGDWIPCRNPQCLAPVLRSSRKAYCSPGCKDAVRRLKLRDAADEYDPANGEIPF
jgi:hypothetical protein